MNRPLPLEISAFELPLGISSDLLWEGGGTDVFWNHTLNILNTELWTLNYAIVSQEILLRKLLQVAELSQNKLTKFWINC